MKKIMNLAWTDIKIEFSEKSTLVFFLLLPLVFTAILGISMGGDDDTITDIRSRLVVVDNDGTQTSDLLVRNLEASGVVWADLQEAPDVESLFVEDNLAAALTIPRGFEDALYAGEEISLDLRTNPNASEGLVIEQAISTAVSQTDSIFAVAGYAVEQRESVQPFTDAAERTAYYEDSLLLAEEVLAESVGEVVATSPVVTDGASDDIPNGFELASPGQLVTWVMITLLGASMVFVYERTGGTLQRLLVTPSRKATIILGKIAGRYGMGLLQMAILIVFGALLFGVDWGNDPLALTLVVLAFGLASVALGVLLGTLVKTYSQANGVTVMASMLLAALGGAWWPLEITPASYQAVVKVLPSTWAMTAFTDIITRGQGLNDVLPEIGILLGFAAVFFTIGIWRLRFE